ncbi:MAG: adenine phosphoribosyltransferase [Candidatus Omnitrophica bacterium]|nr:adenine phosphoribosyltransferase [Candidatus Omnitrophota bacterium]MDD5352479.1 adenine phosphoribosyltransferase [Candidatus Omnitrophota bacterium]MDD5550077.1 adenine phosphoribosyltransferase [Candidatus Omnitrophota bacterium]
MAQPLSRYIRNIPDFPKKGILFRDVTTLIKHKKAFRQAIDKMAAIYKGKKIDMVAAVEARGFIFGGALAYKLGVGFVPVRKKGKLPYKTHQVSYDLEYGTDTLEVHTDAIKKGMRVLIVDDLLATGGTVGAVVEMMNRLKAKIVGILFLIELVDLKGKEKLKDYPLHSLIKFKGE